MTEILDVSDEEGELNESEIKKEIKNIMLGYSKQILEPKIELLYCSY